MLGSLETWTQRAPESWEGCSSPYSTQSLLILGLPRSHTSALLHIPHPKSPPACKQALEASQWLCML